MIGTFRFDGWAGDCMTWSVGSATRSDLSHTIAWDPYQSVVQCDWETCEWAKMNPDAMFDPFVGPSCRVCWHLAAWFRYIWPSLARMLPNPGYGKKTQ